MTSTRTLRVGSTLKRTIEYFYSEENLARIEDRITNNKIKKYSKHEGRDFLSPAIECQFESNVPSINKIQKHEDQHIECRLCSF